ncbi:hypothetical protein [Fortiea sp. LEGE XX443]|uniref:hypothetical protein n=1 Tax=Fortiea sp. LEGE XX443 TaxID=1828611 RepID=UPI001D144FD9|nr:hypothetical protein [Fortiea sp. LEGE XX443]
MINGIDVFSNDRTEERRCKSSVSGLLCGAGGSSRKGASGIYRSSVAGTRLT